MMGRALSVRATRPMGTLARRSMHSCFVKVRTPTSLPPDGLVLSESGRRHRAIRPKLSGLDEGGLFPDRLDRRSQCIKGPEHRARQVAGKFLILSSSANDVTKDS